MNKSLQVGVIGQLFDGNGGGGGEPADAQIGTGTNRQYYTPINGYYDYSQYGAILKASQLTAIAGKQLTGIEFRFQSWTPGYTVNNQTIKLGHIAESKWGNTTYVEIDYLNYTVSDMTTVKSNFNLTITNDWLRFDFDSNFTYNGTSNLLINWENRDGSWSSGYGGSWHTSSSDLQIAKWKLDNSYPTGPTSDRSYYFPSVIIHYLD